MERPLCKECKKKPVTTNGKGGYRRLCWKCYQPSKKKNSQSRKQLRVRKILLEQQGLSCSSCPFVAKHEVQLDVHHKDGNHFNNTIDNCELICSNCHRLKTLEQQTGLSITP